MKPPKKHEPIQIEMFADTTSPIQRDSDIDGSAFSNAYAEQSQASGYARCLPEQVPEDPSTAALPDGLKDEIIDFGDVPMVERAALEPEIPHEIAEPASGEKTAEPPKNKFGNGSKAMGIKKVAAYFDVSESTVWRWSRFLEGFPKPFKIAGTTRWNLHDLDRFMRTLQEKTDIKE